MISRGSGRVQEIPDMKKTLENQGLFYRYAHEITNVPIPGYLFSFDYLQQSARRKDKPLWRIDICAAIPDARILNGGRIQ